jgi:hypothetical protein
MTQNPMKAVLVKKILISAALAAVVFAGGVIAGQQTKARVVGQPKTIIHFVSLKFRPGVSEAERQQAIAGIKTMAAQIPGIKNVWLKTIRVQPQDFNAVFAIEFVNQDAADDYRDHPAHAAWEKQYLGIRDTSLSGQATN